MTTLATGTTTLSSKGQIVIPENVRNQIGAHAGDQFIVYASDHDLILKPIQRPSASEFNKMLLKAQKDAKKAGITKKAVKEAIKEARRKKSD